MRDKNQQPPGDSGKDHTGRCRENTQLQPVDAKYQQGSGNGDRVQDPLGKKAAAEYIEDCSVSEEYRHLFIQLQRSGSKNTLHSGGRIASERKSVSET